VGTDGRVVENFFPASAPPNMDKKWVADLEVVAGWPELPAGVKIKARLGT
jgi:hypothetical protein